MFKLEEEGEVSAKPVEPTEVKHKAASGFKYVPEAEVEELEVGEWVYLLMTEYPFKCYAEKVDVAIDAVIFSSTTFKDKRFDYGTYGKHWFVYKNKERLDVKVLSDILDFISEQVKIRMQEKERHTQTQEPVNNESSEEG